MRNINSNRKGKTNVEYTDRVFDSTKAGVSDSNINWNDFEPYYNESKYHPGKTANKDTYDAVERGNAFIRGRRIMLALQEEAERNIRSHHRHELQAA